MPARKRKTAVQPAPKLVRHDCMPGQWSGAPARQPARKRKTAVQPVPKLVRHDCMPGQWSGAPARQPARKRKTAVQPACRKPAAPPAPKKLVRHNCMLRRWSNGVRARKPVVAATVAALQVVAQPQQDLSDAEDDGPVITRVTRTDDAVATIDLR